MIAIAYYLHANVSQALVSGGRNMSLKLPAHLLSNLRFGGRWNRQN
jgi:hypothetical protein